MPFMEDKIGQTTKPELMGDIAIIYEKQQMLKIPFLCFAFNHI